jgi:prepilin signal peptidase PulO-like enzyme (type II secretory pathway)
LMAAAGAWLGLDALATVLAYAAWAALASVLASVLARAASARWRTGRLRTASSVDDKSDWCRLTLSTRIPFGPYLAFAIWLVWLYGPIQLE